MSNTAPEHKDHWPVHSSVGEMYDGNFLIECSLFKGGFINFGYWKQNTVEHPILAESRLESGKNLYRYVLNRIVPSKKDYILEVACGAGAGSKLIQQEFAFRGYHGLDVSISQIERAKKLNELTNASVSFQVGAAESLSFPDSSFDKVFSIEAAQHFKSLESFIKESYRVLKSDGILAIATFFALSDSGFEEAAELIPTIRDKVDILYSVPKIQSLLHNFGFQNIVIEDIGANVWHGFDAWVAQGEFKDSWDRNWYKGYKKGIFNYYFVLAKKPN